MADAWQGLGAFTVADLPNGFYYIRCEAQEMQNRLLWNGPWTVAGCILQLYLWSVTFQAVFEKLDLAAVWIQIHHLPMKLCGGDILETVASQLDRVLKVDFHSPNRSRAKFSRVYVELDLSQPLQQGTQVKYGEFSVFVLVLYEKLPVFCFRCAMVGYGDTLCPTRSNPCHPEPHMPLEVPSEPVLEDLRIQVDRAMGEQDDIAVEFLIMKPKQIVNLGHG